MKLWLAIFAATLSLPSTAAHGVALLQVNRGETEAPAESSASAASQKPAGQMQAGELDENVGLADGRIRFKFQDKEWTEVIPWFAEEAGLYLQHTDTWPKNTFNLKDPGSYSPDEALDQLNRSLASLDKPFTLIRNGKLLWLKPVNGKIIDELIETVEPEDLNNRGLFELMNVVFDLGDLDEAQVNQVAEDSKTQLTDSNTKNLQVFKASNQLQVRDIGVRLRNIRDIIETAKRKAADDKPSLVTYQLKFQDTETFVKVVGAQLGIPDGKATSEDGLITIISEPLSNRLYVSGTKQKLDRFFAIAKIVDSDPNVESEQLSIEQPFLRTYPITVDPKLAFDLLSTMLEGSDARMQQDENSGAITVLGRKEEHERVKESLAAVEDVSNKTFDIINLEKAPVNEVLGVLQRIYVQPTSLTEPANAGPVLLSNETTQQIIVSGTPKEVSDIRSIALQYDALHQPAETGPRSSTVILPMNKRDQDRLLPALSDLLSTKNLDNAFNIVRPSQRKDMDERIRRGRMQNSIDKSDEELMEELIGPPPSANRSRSRSTPPRWVPQSKLQKKPASALQRVSALAFLALGVQRASLISNVAILQQDGGTASLGSGSRDFPTRAEKESVPGAPIEFRFNEYGLTIESDDLDAVDDMRAAIENFLGDSGEVQSHTIFELKHRDVKEMQLILENILGLSDGSGGGDAGGNPITGIVDNLVPGGNLLEGLFDGSSGSDAVSELEGDVRFSVDVRFNVLIVKGATGNDLSYITQLIDYFDRTEAETKPELFGSTQAIKVNFRDAQEVVELVKAQFPTIIYNDQAKQGNQGGGGGGGDAVQALKALQAVTGGGRGGGGGNAAANDGGQKQTVVLGVDAANNTIIVSGPDYMYDVILAFVKSVDIEPPPMFTEVLPIVPNFEFILEALKQTFPGKVKTSDVQDSQTDGSNNQNSQGDQTPAQERAAAIRRQIEGQVQRQGGGAGNRNGGAAGGNQGGGGRNRGGNATGGTRGGNATGGTRGGGATGGTRGGGVTGGTRGGGATGGGGTRRGGR